MAVKTQIISNEIKQKVRRDYVLGKGSNSHLSRTYGLARKTIADWAISEKWDELKEMFASEDELFVCKRQLMMLNRMISDYMEPEALISLVKCKQMIAEIFFTLAHVPRRPIAKLEKQIKNDIHKLLEDAAREEQRETVTETPVIDVKESDKGAESDTNNPLEGQ